MKRYAINGNEINLTEDNKSLIARVAARLSDAADQATSFHDTCVFERGSSDMTAFLLDGTPPIVTR